MKRNELTGLGLGSLQSEVIEIVWELGEATVNQVIKRIAQRRPVAYTTVLVAMQNLERKKWLTHRSAGPAYVYRPWRYKTAQAAGAAPTLQPPRAAFDWGAAPGYPAAIA